MKTKRDELSPMTQAEVFQWLSRTEGTATRFVDVAQMCLDHAAIYLVGIKDPGLVKSLQKARYWALAARVRLGRRMEGRIAANLGRSRKR